jgi:hypothetical protein
MNTPRDTVKRVRKIVKGARKLFRSNPGSNHRELINNLLDIFLQSFGDTGVTIIHSAPVKVPEDERVYVFKWDSISEFVDALDAKFNSRRLLENRPLQHQLFRLSETRIILATRPDVLDELQRPVPNAMRMLAIICGNYNDLTHYYFRARAFDNKIEGATDQEKAMVQSRVERFSQLCDIPKFRIYTREGCLVCGCTVKLRTCSRCECARYCGKDHQREHWGIHKHDCKELSSFKIKA